MEHLSLADDRSGTPHGARKGPGFSADAGGAASFDHLPLELRLKCLAYCDWQTLSRVACISRSTRALVSYLVRCPYWRAHTEEQPAVLCTDFATEEERIEACSRWAKGLTATLCGRGKPDICFVFVSSRSHANLPLMLRALRANLAKCTVLAGVVAPGVLGHDTSSGDVREVDSPERVGLVVSVLHLPPGSQVTATYMKDGLAPERPGAEWRAPEGDEVPKGGASAHCRTWLVLSDRHSHVGHLSKELARRFPGEALCGGMGGDADGASSLIVGLPGRSPGESLHAELTSGSLLLSISGPGIEAVSTTARGMRCISQRFTVAQVSANVDLSPVGRVTLVQQLQNTIGLTTKSDELTWVPVGGTFTPTSALVAALQAQGANVAPRAPLFFGVRPPGKSQRQDDPGRMVMLQMHDPNNLMRTSGFVSVQHPVEHGMMSAFYTPQPALSAQHLRAALEEAAAKLFRGVYPPQLESGGLPSSSNAYASPDSIHTVLSGEPSPVYGCLLFPCVAKGQRYYEEPHVESSMVQAAFPDASLCGFFGNGEIGPAPPDELPPDNASAGHMMGYSTVVCFLKLNPAPPPPPDWEC